MLSLPGDPGVWNKVLFLNDVLLEPRRDDLEAGVVLVLLYWGYWGGVVNLEINDDCQRFATPSDMDGMEIGGINVFVTPDPVDPHFGQLRLVDPDGLPRITQFAIGGQELIVDNIIWGTATDSECGNNIREATEMCDGLDDAACPRFCAPDCTCTGVAPGIIPTASEWGLVAMALLFLTAAKVYFGRQRQTA